ncbi:conserved hypothetical protein [Histoplasma capsulatum G186AR]|uniref:Uncharacterized protein n=1 Tax=Ajellomyces capsulatus (strain G186AR / H82 / ATCC MYA-2454 / RMSCC 2432) TaxID=447093 RepID=C0NY40_AJECG|nr:uncharacterized protein HCBG_07834 [Histoplasma capsulatum G186AR]EEH03708.1 conserved hypothetical protein [Histoplasma capsulatum G186AR]
MASTSPLRKPGQRLTGVLSMYTSTIALRDLEDDIFAASNAKRNLTEREIKIKLCLNGGVLEELKVESFSSLELAGYVHTGFESHRY